MKAIGGYFELEMRQGNEYHLDAIRLNTGRNAFEYILRAKGYKKVYLPYYTCDVMLEPIHKLKLEVEYYHIDIAFWPVVDFSQLKPDEVLVYTNYFGICETQVKVVAAQCRNLIVDNSQAFFSKPFPGTDTFYSPRKFFGLPDGAYLYTNKFIDDKLDTDSSFRRFEHLLGRIDKGAEEFYEAFKENDAALSGQQIKHMSALTLRILQSINYGQVAKKRRKNFLFLHEKLATSNNIEIKLHDNIIPMFYPYFVNDGQSLKELLIHNKLFVATYWPEVQKLSPYDSVEYNYALNLVAIPCDQRYSSTELIKIIDIMRNK